MEDRTIVEPGLPVQDDDEGPVQDDDEEEVGALFTIAGVAAKLALSQIKGRDCWSTCGNRGMLPCPKACGPVQDDDEEEV